MLHVYKIWPFGSWLSLNLLNAVIYLLVLVVRSGDLVSYCAEEGVGILGEGEFLISDSFRGNERTKYCLTSKVFLEVMVLILSIDYAVLFPHKMLHCLKF